MIASTMLYASTIGALIALTAAAVERAAQGRLQRRYIWSFALIAISVAPVFAVVRAPLVGAETSGYTAPLPARAVSHTRFAGEISSTTTTANAIWPGEIPHPSVFASTGRNTLLAREARRLSRNSSADAVLATFWALSSVILACWILVISVRCHLVVTALPRILIDGFDVALSEATGPAVVGVFFRETILLPRWAVRLPADDRQLILSHEAEHVAAHDSRRVLLALSAIIAMPWNPATWWCFLRLRRAVELDCDARVVSADRDVDVQAYGLLLLRVAARDLDDHGLTFQPGFLRMSTQLERRIRALAVAGRLRPRPIIQGVAAAFIFGSATAFIPLPARIAPPQVRIDPSASVQQPGHARVLAAVPPSIAKMGEMLGALASGRSNAKVASGPTGGVSQDESVSVITDSAASDAITKTSGNRGVATDTTYTGIDSPVFDTLEKRMLNLDHSMQSSDSSVRDLGERMRELGKVMQQQAGARTAIRARWDTQIRAAAPANFPDLGRSATSRTTLWFLADPSGRVLRAVRDEDGSPKNVSPEIVGRKFGLDGASAVSDVYYARYQANGHSVATIWSIAH